MIKLECRELRNPGGYAFRLIGQFRDIPEPSSVAASGKRRLPIGAERDLVDPPIMAKRRAEWPARGGVPELRVL